ncbi:MAG: ANTAR domain-containing protein [Desulfitobacterium hafniense]|nr:ANTAR domain-containing protein [Desulfitobacterium hafniense]
MKRILLVSQEKQLVQDIKTILVTIDYQVIATIDNGMDALRMLHRYEPDLVIMSWVLKGLSGTDLLQNILALHMCPTIVILGSESQQELPQIIKSEPHHIAFPPLRAIDIIGAIIQAEHKFKKEQEIRLQVRKLEEELKTRKLIYQAILEIIHKRGYDEETAYNRIRSHSMSTRRSIQAVAKDIIKGIWLPD